MFLSSIDLILKSLRQFYQAQGCSVFDERNQMMNVKTIVGIAGPMVALTLAGCASEMKVTTAGPVPEARIAAPAKAATPPAAPQIADATIADTVKAELAKPALAASHLKVSVKSGEVTLAGDVNDGQQLAKIAMAVQKLPGVKAVIPEMTPQR
jgi:osmotically-inducible protein OsmY